MLTPDTIHFRSGQVVPESGMYEQCDKDNQCVGVVTCTKGEAFPLTQCTGGYWKVHVPTYSTESTVEEVVSTPEPMEEAVTNAESMKMELRWKTPSD